MILGVSRRTAILLLLTYALSQCTGPLVLHTVRHPRVVTIFGRVKEVSWITRDRNALRLLCESRNSFAVVTQYTPNHRYPHRKPTIERRCNVHVLLRSGL
ncbi:hypothetical protein BC629DRAFT_393690 [Irpex lacteus]|nr:hypothetical protein BC629DRAFT_393690 [Irpex lacteus]